MKLRDIAVTDARFFLKSEYGPLSSDWPVVAFSQKSFETQIRRQYRTSRDFIVYLGTKGDETPVAADRGALLSVIELDLTHLHDTYDHISAEAKRWASNDYPNQWLKCFRFTKAFDIPSRPLAEKLLVDTDLKMWHIPFREVIGKDRDLLLDIEIAPFLDSSKNESSQGPTLADLLRPENNAAAREAVRLANLVFNRVDLSGQIVERRAPQRSAPSDLQLQIFSLLVKVPLTCTLCGSQMHLTTSNKLLKISGDRKDSSLGDYGPSNYQLVHLGCNLAKNNATAEHFAEWLAVVRGMATS